MLRCLLGFSSICVVLVCRTQVVSSKPTSQKRVTGLDPKDVIVECFPDSLRVTIKKSNFPRIKSADQLHFLDPVCLGGENKTHFISATPYRSCGVSKNVKWNGIVYSNTLMTGYPDDENHISSCPVVSIKFTCVFSHFQFPKPRFTRAASKDIQCEHLVAIGPRIRNGVIARITPKRKAIRMRTRVMTCPTLIGIGPPVTEGVYSRLTVQASRGFRTKSIICKPLKSSGIYSLQLKAYKDPSFAVPIQDVIVMTEDVIDIYYDMKLRSPDSFLRISPSRCYATPNRDPKHTVQYVFIKDGCTNDETVRFYQSPHGSFRFSMKTFRFTGYPDAMFFVHCDAVICDSEDKESLCAKGCEAKAVTRQRRDGTKPGRQINNGFSKLCQYDAMQVAIERGLFPNAEMKQFQLDDSNCIATMNKTHFVFNIQRGKCGTLSKILKKDIVISNTLYYKISGVEMFAIPYKCKYSKTVGSSTARSLLIANHRRFVSVSISKSYFLNKKVVFDSTVSDGYSTPPLNIQVVETNGILDITATPVSKDFVFIVDHCKVRPQMTSAKKVLVIENGCVKNIEQVFMVSTANSSRIYVDYSKWSKKGNKVFVKCHFTVCHRNSPWSKCESKPCFDLGLPRRERRSAEYEKLKASISCSPKLISVAIEKASIPRLQAKDLHLRINACQPKQNETHIIFETKPYQCRTSVKSFGSTIEYSNIILEQEETTVGLVRRTPLFKLPFKCIFVPRVINGFTGFRAKKSLVRFSGIATGTYGVHLELFSDALFNDRLTAANAKLNHGSTMYFQVSVAAPNVKVALYLEMCYGRPFFGAGENERYTFIRENCAVDETVEFYNTGKDAVKRFSLSPFQFSNKVHKSVFVNCIVSACNPNDKNSRCFHQCPTFPRLA